MNDCFGAVWSNLGAFLDALRGLSASEAMDLSPEGGFCLSTRSRSASENWVWLLPDLVTQERAEATLRFFGDRGLPFVWPLPGDCEAAETLRAAGLKEAGQLEAMSLPADADPGRGGKELTFRTVRTREEALRWASVAWLAFGGEPPVPVSALNGAEAMADSPLRLGAAMAGEEAVGTFLLSPFAASLGVYYFAVLPGYRRRGHGHDGGGPSRGEGAGDGADRPPGDAGRRALLSGGGLRGPRGDPPLLQLRRRVLRL